MKKGINIWSFPQGMSIEECMRVAKSAGFEGIELSINETGELGLESNKNDVLKYKKMAEDTGIEISGLAAGLYWKYPFTSNSREIRKRQKISVRNR